MRTGVAAAGGVRASVRTRESAGRCTGRGVYRRHRRLGKAQSMQRLVRAGGDAEHREPVLRVDVVEDVVVVDGDVVAAADPLQQRGRWGVGISGDPEYA